MNLIHMQSLLCYLQPDASGIQTVYSTLCVWPDAYGFSLSLRCHLYKSYSYGPVKIYVRFTAGSYYFCLFPPWTFCRNQIQHSVHTDWETSYLGREGNKSSLLALFLYILGFFLATINIWCLKQGNFSCFPGILQKTVTKFLEMTKARAITKGRWVAAAMIFLRLPKYKPTCRAPNTGDTGALPFKGGWHTEVPSVAGSSGWRATPCGH